MKLPWYVIGHQNPDADAICSAIGHAAYLRACGETRCVGGSLCVRFLHGFKGVLEKAELEAPPLVEDVRPTAASICRKECGDGAGG